MVQEYFIESATKEVKQTGNGKPYSGLKINGNWVNIEGDCLWMKGTTQSLELKQNGQWTWAKRGPQPSQQEQQQKQAQATNNGKQGVTCQEYMIWLKKMHYQALQLEPNDATARAAIVNTAMIAFTSTNAKLKADEPETSVPEVPAGEEPPPDDREIPF